MEKSKSEYDHNLYSRQEFTYGAETMRKLIKLKVLHLGVNGLGLEILKNLVLAGPAKVTLFDPRTSENDDHSWNYYLLDQKIIDKQSRAESVLRELSELNSNVKVDVLNAATPDQLLTTNLDAYDVVVVSELYPFDFMVKLNEAVRKHEKKMIVAVSGGFFGLVFNDFGPAHVVTDKNGEQPKECILSMITEDGMVAAIEDKRHDLEVGDHVRFREIVGMEELNGKICRVSAVPNPFTFKIDNFDPKLYGKYVRNGIVQEVKMPIEQKYKPFSELAEATVLPDSDLDFENMHKIEALQFLFVELWKHATWNKRGDARPELFDVDYFKEIAKKAEEQIAKIEDADKKASLQKFWGSDLPKFVVGLLRTELSPVSTFFGGIAAQEIVKVTGKYGPIDQLFIHEFYSTTMKDKTWDALPKQGTGQQAVIGSDALRFLEEAKVFMIGAGALGCELLKMFSLMGVSSAGAGELTCTDNDAIEVSNLNRQFLFRKEHVGSNKSQTAVAVTQRMNPKFRAKGLIDLVSEATEK